MKESEFLINQLKTIIDRLAGIESNKATRKSIREIKESINFMSLFDEGYSETIINERQLSELTDHRFNTWELYHELARAAPLGLSCKGHISYVTSSSNAPRHMFNRPGQEQRTLALIADDEKLTDADQYITLRLVGIDKHMHYLVNIYIDELMHATIVLNAIKALLPDFAVSIDKQ